MIFTLTDFKSDKVPTAFLLMVQVSGALANR
jgi:hypothetical protein